MNNVHLSTKAKITNFGCRGWSLHTGLTLHALKNCANSLIKNIFIIFSLSSLSGKCRSILSRTTSPLDFLSWSPGSASWSIQMSFQVNTKKKSPKMKTLNCDITHLRLSPLKEILWKIRLKKTAFVSKLVHGVFIGLPSGFNSLVFVFPRFPFLVVKLECFWYNKIMHIQWNGQANQQKWIINQFYRG